MKRLMWEEGRQIGWLFKNDEMRGLFCDSLSSCVYVVIGCCFSERGAVGGTFIGKRWMLIFPAFKFKLK